MKEMRVSVLQEQDIEEMIANMFAYLMPTFCRGEKCILKPNLFALKEASTGATTHPELVQALVKRLRDNFAEVLIVESTSDLSDAEMKFEFCGYEDVAKTTDARAPH